MELWRRLKRKLLARPEQTVCEGEANMTYAALAGCAEALPRGRRSSATAQARTAPTSVRPHRLRVGATCF